MSKSELEKQECRCVSCAGCGGQGFINPGYMEDRFDIERCDECGGSGIVETCDRCHELIEMDQDADPWH